MKERSIVLIVVIVIAGILFGGYLIGVAANTVMVRAYNLQRECQGNGAYWDSYHRVCAPGAEK